MSTKIILSLSLCLSVSSCSNDNISSSNDLSSSSNEESVIDLSSSIVKENYFMLNSDYRNNKYISFTGRTYYKQGVIMSQSNTYFEISFYGSKLECYAGSTLTDGKSTYLSVFIDGNSNPNEAHKVKVPMFDDYFTLVDGLENTMHTLKVYKITESQENYAKIVDFKTDGYFLNKQETTDKLKIEFFGDSITCGYCVEGVDESTPYLLENENSTKTYAYYLASQLEADFQVLSGSGWGMYAGYNGTLTQIIPSYFDKCDFKDSSQTWDNNDFIPDIVVINLGTNDSNAYGLNNYSSTFVSNFKNAYEEFIKKINQTYGDDTKIILASGMMNMHSDITNAIDEVSSSFTNCYRMKHNSLSVGGSLPAYHPNQNMHIYAAMELESLINSII